MRRRKLRWVLAGLAVLLLAVGGFVLWPQSDRITRENYDRIKIGMTIAEAEAILGPPGDFSSGPLKYTQDSPRGRSNGAAAPRDFQLSSRLSRATESQWEPVEWRNDHRIAFVYVGSGELVRYAWFEEVERIDQSSVDNLLWRAKRQWQKWFPER